MNKISNENVLLGQDDETKVLGLCWAKASDELLIYVKPKIQSKITKRSILSDIAKLYDPNGFIAPVISRAKMLMQDVWRLKEINWDDLVTEQIKNDWIKIYSNLYRLSEFEIKRWLNIQKGSKVQIHAFCDASERAYGIAIYIRVIDTNGTIRCSLLSAKSRVAPIKTISIPRLELLAAVMLSKQMDAIINTCELKPNSVTLWSDSMIVLYWIKKQSHKAKI